MPHFLLQPAYEALAVMGPSGAGKSILMARVHLNEPDQLQPARPTQERPRCQATRHRVNPLHPLRNKPRISLPFFMIPDLEKQQEPFTDLKPSKKTVKKPPGWPKRNRANAFCLDRMRLWPTATKKYYEEEFKVVEKEVEEEERKRQKLLSSRL